MWLVCGSSASRDRCAPNLTTLLYAVCNRAVVGLGAVFTLGTSVMVWLNNYYNGYSESSEHFSTAGHGIKTGLTASDIVSKWTW